jgi:hypothetical protein
MLQKRISCKFTKNTTRALKDEKKKREKRHKKEPIKIQELSLNDRNFISAFLLRRFLIKENLI